MTSSIDGDIGSGGSFSRSLSDGSHTITASVTDSGGATGTASVSITVGTPTTIPMYVADITMQMKGPNLDTIVTIRADTDGSGDASGADAPAASVVPHVALCDDASPANCFFTTTTTATDSAGQVKYKLLHAPSGTAYTMEVVGVDDASGTYQFTDPFTGSAANPSAPFVIP